MDIWANHICARCWQRFDTGHPHDASFRRTVVLAVPDTCHDSQRHWIMLSHVIANAVWNTRDVKAAYNWDPNGGYGHDNIANIGSALSEASSRPWLQRERTPMQIHMRESDLDIYVVLRGGRAYAGLTPYIARVAQIVHDMEVV